MTVFTARAMLPLDWKLDRKRPRLSYFAKYREMARRFVGK